MAAGAIGVALAIFQVSIFAPTRRRFGICAALHPDAFDEPTDSQNYMFLLPPPPSPSHASLHGLRASSVSFSGGLGNTVQAIADFLNVTVTVTYICIYIYIYVCKYLYMYICTYIFGGGANLDGEPRRRATQCV